MACTLKSFNFCRLCTPQCGPDRGANCFFLLIFFLLLKIGLTPSEFLLQQTCAFCAESEGYASGTTSNLILPLEYIILAILVMIMAIFCDSEDSDDDSSQRSSFVLSKNVKQEINKYLSNISSHQNRSKVFGINLFLKTIV